MVQSRTWLSLLLVIVCVLNGSTGFARGSRVAKPEPTVEAAVEGCKQNATGMQIITRDALNMAVNPLADRVSSIDWDKFCTCFGPKHFEVAKVLKEDRKNHVSGPNEKYVQQWDSIAVTCAAAGAPAVTSIGPTVASHPSGNQEVNNPRFAGIVAHCVGSPQGYLSNVQVHLKVQKSPRASKVMAMNPGKYCNCYVTHMRNGLGDDVAHQYLSSIRIPASLDMAALDKTASGAFETCAAEQIPFR